MTIIVIGGGKMGLSHLALATQYAGKNNVALCDNKYSTRMLFRFLGYQVFRDIESAVKCLPKISGVIIATPTYAHASLAKWAIDNRVPCFIEKPLTLDASKSNDLVKASVLSPSITQMGFVMRYVASFLRLREIISDGDLGPVLEYRASMKGNVITKINTTGWQGDFSKGGGCLNEYGPHIIDLCRFCFGAVQSIGSVEKKHKFSTLADDSIAFDLVHENDVKGNVAIDWCDDTKRKSVIEIHVKFGCADLRVDNSTVQIIWNSSEIITPYLQSKFSTFLRPLNVGYYLRGEEFSLEIEEFIGNCMGVNMHVGSLPNDIVPNLSDGAEVDRLIDIIAQKAGLK